MSAVLGRLFDSQLAVLSKKKDLRWYRWVLAHEHIILRQLPCVKDRPKYETWPDFAKAFRLDVTKPLKRVGGVHNCTPLIYAVIANNLPVVQYLISCKANVNDTMGLARGTNYQGYAPLHIICKVGHDEASRKIFDALLAAGADAYKYAYGGSIFRKPFYKDPLCTAVGAFNQHMCVYYMHHVQANFLAVADPHKSTTELILAGKGLYKVVLESLKQGAAFKSANRAGMGVLTIFCIVSREHRYETDCRILDLLNERGLLGDLDATFHGEYGPGMRSMCLYETLWYLYNKGCLQNHALAAMVHAIWRGSYLHVAAYMDQPEIIVWLMNHGASTQRTNGLGQTPLDLAVGLGHERCIAVLLGDKTAHRRYSKY